MSDPTKDPLPNSLAQAMLTGAQWDSIANSVSGKLRALYEKKTDELILKTLLDSGQYKNVTMKQPLAVHQSSVYINQLQVGAFFKAPGDPFQYVIKAQDYSKLFSAALNTVKWDVTGVHVSGTYHGKNIGALSYAVDPPFQLKPVHQLKPGDHFVVKLSASLGGYAVVFEVVEISHGPPSGPASGLIVSGQPLEGDIALGYLKGPVMIKYDDTFELVATAREQKPKFRKPDLVDLKNMLSMELYDL